MRAEWEASHQIFERSRDTMVALPMPIIAAINRHASAGGCETALGCDFAWAVRTTRLALPEGGAKAAG